MGVTLEDSGTQTATLTTEHTLVDIDTAGVYTLHVDTVNMQAGDILELVVYQIVLTGGTRHGVMFGRWEGAQHSKFQIKKSKPISNDLTDSGSLRFTLKQTVGTGRDYDWKVLKHA